MNVMQIAHPVYRQRQALEAKPVALPASIMDAKERKADTIVVQQEVRLGS